MPPSPQNGESPQAAAVRWLTQLLAALVEQSAEGQLVVTREALAADHAEQSLIEEEAKGGAVLLKFGVARKMAIYPLGGAAQWQQAKTEPSSTVSLPTPTQEPFLSQINLFPNPTGENPPAPVRVAPPKDGADLKRMEETLRKQKLANQIVARQRDQAQQRVQSLESLLETEGVLGRR